MQEQQAETDRLRMDVQRAQEQMRSLGGRLEGAEMESQRLAREMEATRQRGDAAGQAEMKALHAQVDELARRVGELSAAREKDKQAILDDVSRKVAELLRRTGGSTSGGGRTSGTPPRRSDVGYEHVVANGETLSAIAQAYGTSTKVLMQENNLKSDVLRVGQKLFVPKPR